MIENSKFHQNKQASELISQYKKKRYYDALQDKSQGFWLQNDIKSSLQKIRFRSEKIKTQIPKRNNDNQKQIQFSRRRLSTLKKKTRLFKQINEQKVNNHQNSHLPQLSELINYKQQDQVELTRQKRWKVIHLIIFALNRRYLGNLYEALDLLLLTSTYFQKGDREIRLKAICVYLISKIHSEIKIKISKGLTVVKKKKLKIKNRKSSLLVQSILSKQKFMQNFVQKLRLTKLIFQSTYQRQSLKKSINLIKKKSSQSNYQKKQIIINGKYTISIPQPSELVISNQQSMNTKQIESIKQLTNYKFVVVLIDDTNNRFPYQYPRSLSQHIDQRFYRTIMSKINGLLLPEGRCHSWNSTIKLFFMPILIIFIIFCLFTLLNRSLCSSILGRIMNMFLCLLLIILLAYKIKTDSSKYTSFVQISTQIKAYLSYLQKQYQKSNLKFILGQQTNAIIIVLPCQQSEISMTQNTLTQIQQEDQNTISKQHSNDNWKNQSSGNQQDKCQEINKRNRKVRCSRFLGLFQQIGLQMAENQQNQSQSGISQEELSSQSGNSLQNDGNSQKSEGQLSNQGPQISGNLFKVYEE